MATRSGDLDPGVLLYLMRVKQMNADALEGMLNHDSGLKALSNGQPDMRDLEVAAEAGDERAQLATEIFCAAICKVVGAYAAVLGRLELLVFSGGIGEHSALVRNRVCGGLRFLGIACAPSGNTEHVRPLVERARVRVVPSQEDIQIARHCRAMMKSSVAETT